MDAPVAVGSLRELDPRVVARWFGPGAPRMARVGAVGTGSCFYWSLCYILNVGGFRGRTRSEQDGIAERYRCGFRGSFTEEHFDRLRGGDAAFQSARDDFCRPAVWADQTAITFVAEQEDVNALFLDVEVGKVYCGVVGARALSGAPQRTGVIAWVNGRTHFEPIVRIDGVDGPPGAEIRVTALFDPGESPRDRALVDAVVERYVETCSLEPGPMSPRRPPPGSPRPRPPPPQPQPPIAFPASKLLAWSGHGAAAEGVGGRPGGPFQLAVSAVWRRAWGGAALEGGGSGGGGRAPRVGERAWARVKWAAIRRMTRAQLVESFGDAVPGAAGMTRAQLVGALRRMTPLI